MAGSAPKVRPRFSAARFAGVSPGLGNLLPRPGIPNRVYSPPGFSRESAKNKVEDRIFEAVFGVAVSAIFAAVKRKYAMQVLALGIAVTALFIASSRITYVSEPPVEERDHQQESESATWRGGEFHVETRTVTAYTNDEKHRAQVWRTDEAFAMLSVPDPENPSSCEISSVRRRALRFLHGGKSQQLTLVSTWSTRRMCD